MLQETALKARRKLSTSCSVSNPGLLWTSLILPPPRRLALAVSCSALYPVMQWMQPFWVPEWTSLDFNDSMLLGQSFSLPESHEPAEGDQKANQPWPYFDQSDVGSFRCLSNALYHLAISCLDWRSSGRIEHLVACALGKTVTSGSLASAGCKTKQSERPAHICTLQRMTSLVAHNPSFPSFQPLGSASLHLGPPISVDQLRSPSNASKESSAPRKCVTFWHARDATRDMFCRVLGPRSNFKCFSWEQQTWTCSSGPALSTLRRISLEMLYKDRVIEFHSHIFSPWPRYRKAWASILKQSQVVAKSRASSLQTLQAVGKECVPGGFTEQTNTDTNDKGKAKVRYMRSHLQSSTSFTMNLQSSTQDFLSTLNRTIVDTFWTIDIHWLGPRQVSEVTDGQVLRETKCFANLGQPTSKENLVKEKWVGKH